MGRGLLSGACCVAAGGRGARNGVSTKLESASRSGSAMSLLLGPGKGEGICRSGGDRRSPCCQQSPCCRALAPLSLLRATVAERHLLFSDGL